jgi:hypothetical protein
MSLDVEIQRALLTGGIFTTPDRLSFLDDRKAIQANSKRFDGKSYPQNTWRMKVQELTLGEVKRFARYEY